MYHSISGFVSYGNFNLFVFRRFVVSSRLGALHADSCGFIRIVLQLKKQTAVLSTCQVWFTDCLLQAYDVCRILCDQIYVSVQQQQPHSPSQCAEHSQLSEFRLISLLRHNAANILGIHSSQRRAAVQAADEATLYISHNTVSHHLVRFSDISSGNARFRGCLLTFPTMSSSWLGWRVGWCT